LESKLPNWIDKTVSSRIRARRRELKLSQDMLAERLGVTFQQIQKYERGANRVSAGRLFELAQALNTSIMYFYEGATQMNAVLSKGLAEESAEFAPPIDPEIMELVTAFQAIDGPEKRKAVLTTVKQAATAARKPRDKPGAD
jgi:transcriptional regulator with XRE-family HTH domain